MEIDKIIEKIDGVCIIKLLKLKFNKELIYNDYKIIFCF